MNPDAKLRLLKKNAVPSIFNFPLHLKRNEPKPRSRVRRNLGPLSENVPCTYNYVRRIFAKSLPHPKTLQK
jgi:hypothetical protein